MATKEWKEKNKEQILAYRRQWYVKNKKTELTRLKKSNRQRRRSLREWTLSLKLVCTKCGEDHPWCIEFHHNDPKQKEFGISQAIRSGCSKKRIMEEIKKCTVLCSNCHRKLHCEWYNSVPECDGCARNSTKVEEEVQFL